MISSNGQAKEGTPPRVWLKNIYILKIKRKIIIKKTCPSFYFFFIFGQFFMSACALAICVECGYVMGILMRNEERETVCCWPKGGRLACWPARVVQSFWSKTLRAGGGGDKGINEIFITLTHRTSSSRFHGWRSCFCIFNYYFKHLKKKGITT